jgi:Protein of unknown function (DUF3866)
VIKWRSGVVSGVRREWSGAVELDVSVGTGQLRALAYPELTGRPRPGDRVLLNTTALHLRLGTGGYALVVAIPDRLPPDPAGPGHLIKARYTPLQTCVLGADEQGSPFHETLAEADDLGGMPVAVADLHSALPAVLAAFHAERQPPASPAAQDAPRPPAGAPVIPPSTAGPLPPVNPSGTAGPLPPVNPSGTAGPLPPVNPSGTAGPLPPVNPSGTAGPLPRVAYVMLDGGALPAWFSRTCAALREIGWLAATVTVGQAFGGDLEAVTLHSGLLAARHVLGAELAVVSQGPGNLGTGTKWGFSGVASGEAVNAAAVLRGRPVASLRISEADPRKRHRGISHHSLTAYGRVALARADVVLPDLPGDFGARLRAEAAPLAAMHNLVLVSVAGLADVLRDCPVPLSTMGRGLDEDRAYFLAAAAAGRHAAGLAAQSRG